VIQFFGYAAMAVCAAVAVYALWFGRERTALVALAYLLAYEGLFHFLVAVGHYSLVPYMSLAVAIDWWFFYLFLARGARLSAGACVLSLFYGGLTVIEDRVSGSLLYGFYEYVGMAVCLLILFDGVSRARCLEHHSVGHRWSLYGWFVGRVVQAAKKAKG